jgi:hypothetical protein
MSSGFATSFWSGDYAGGITTIWNPQPNGTDSVQVSASCLANSSKASRRTNRCLPLHVYEPTPKKYMDSELEISYQRRIAYKVASRAMMAQVYARLVFSLLLCGDVRLFGFGCAWQGIRTSQRSVVPAPKICIEGCWQLIRLGL